MTSQPRYCAACSAPVPPHQWACPACDYPSQVGVAWRPQPPPEPQRLSGPLGSLGLALSNGEYGVLWGGPGTGKTSLALSAFSQNEAAEAAEVAVLTTEMRADLVWSYAQRMGAAVAWVAQVAIGDDGCLAVQGTPPPLAPGQPWILDSASVPWFLARALVGPLEAGRGIVIQQITGRGSPRGGPSASHYAAFETYLAGGRLQVRKNRHGPLSSANYHFGQDGRLALDS